MFDTNRSWSRYLPAIARLFPEARLLCCVRNPAWILDSIERLIQRKTFLASRMFEKPQSIDVYTRTDALMKNGFVGSSVSALRQAWFGESAERIRLAGGQAPRSAERTL